MCRTVHALLQTVICGIQMLVRVFMTVILMLENLIRMILQTLYNFISFMLQMLSLIPICVVFLLTARLKCFMCGGGGPCPVNRGGTCDCLMSAVALVIVFFIFRATGILDKIFYKIGYAKALGVTKFTPTPGEITECSRNDSFSPTTTEGPEYYYDFNYGSSTTTEQDTPVDSTTALPSTTRSTSIASSASIAPTTTVPITDAPTTTVPITDAPTTAAPIATTSSDLPPTNLPTRSNRRNMMTTILYYLA